MKTSILTVYNREQKNLANFIRILLHNNNCYNVSALTHKKKIRLNELKGDFG